MKDLFAKYDVQIPRYTSYPTVPYWTGLPSTEQWFGDIKRTLQNPAAAWSLYLHIPFCETLCTFCGCNNIITKNHSLEEQYISLVHKEWDLYKAAAPDFLERPLRLIHLGGGSPTFFQPESLRKLLKPILDNVKKEPGFEASIEVDPRKTTAAQIQVLRELGFNRVSMGVQDFEPEVQKLVNRIQPYSITANLIEICREHGIPDVNFDLIYGLARQTPDSMRRTAKQTMELRPSRIALYSFALVPWIKPAQRLFKDEDLPSGPAKRELYEIAREEFLSAGYVEIGMDHFALPDDALALAAQNKKLHRNFMGYTDQFSDLALALGISGISQTPYSYHQNEKLLAKYEESLHKNKIPSAKGHLMTAVDQERHRQILTLITQLKVTFTDAQQEAEAEKFLEEMLKDRLVTLENHQLTITPKGKPFLRNVCAFFDEHMKANKPNLQIFSKSI